MLPIQRLEQYTLKRPQEVLIVLAEVDQEPDQIMVFKGFSSSLMRPTAFDPDLPVLPEHGVILTIDRAAAPYHATNPQYIAQGLTWAEMNDLLVQVNL